MADTGRVHPDAGSSQEAVVLDGRSKEANALRRYAFDLLARREHSRRELRDKLTSRGEDGSLVEAVLNSLEQEGLQSDQRFAEALVRARIERGQGPVRIRHELRIRGVSDEIGDEVMVARDEDWFELAQRVAVRRFGDQMATDRREQARRLRFLQYRGFTTEQCRAALAD